ncbi:splicing factor, Prp19-binding domain-containing protein [Mucor mucedo]|uniref:splicing factor, Prp19-binding domain-containing protein n=1 Tax=Mucor mucedo TaxID=29922 RepID=UPI002220FF4C|nr:splicing factor, Prp19-binding domain-containing protein [Mucor mucedo]KAI7895245.1 splicing factor, Prp19-binding domain-containing protein [Mucor mucedo]
MSARPTQKQQRPQNQARRYRAGQVPENYVDDLSDSEEEEEQIEEPVRRKRGEVQFAQKEVDTGVKQTTISEKDASTDRRLRRLQQAQQTQHVDEDSGRRRRRQVESDEEEEDVDEDEKARERMLLKQRALQQQEEELESEQEGSEEGSEEEGSSEYESSSEEEDTIARLPKPVFIPKARRETILQQEKLAKEEEEREKRLELELEERKKQSHDMLAEELRREKEEATQKEITEYEDAVDDTDGLDEEAEFDAWRIRELNRIKRDREERIAREKEEEELERRRALPEDVRLKEDLERAKESKNKEKGQHTFMQKYYHKGAFYQDPESEVLQRDYSAPTIDEVRNKDVLPKIMQVKNFGLAGRTKYTHLVDQDTSSRDSPWEKPLAKRRRKDDDRS